MKMTTDSMTSKRVTPFIPFVGRVVLFVFVFLVVVVYIFLDKIICYKPSR